MSVLKYYNTQTGTWLPAALGDIGPTGPTGAPGNDSMVPGPTGDQGPQGPTGNDGVTGPQGEVGATGPQGELGPTGNDGAVGPTGPQGEFGATGPQGELGPTGNDGAPGMTGPQGEVGPTGVPGTDALWNFLGEYSDTPMYAEGDIVTYNGETYRRNGSDNNVTGYHPTVTGYWDKIAERGADGAEGPTGPAGEVGPTGPQGERAQEDRLTTGSYSVILGADGTLTTPGNLIPNADLAYDLGSTSSQWRSLYVGTTTIYLGGIPLSITSEGSLTVNGDVLSNSGLTVITPEDYEVPGVTTMAFTGTGVTVSRIDDITTVTIPGGGNANTGNVVFDGNQLYVGGTGFLNLENADDQIEIGSNGESPLIISVNEGAYRWEFGTDGWLSFPGTFPGGAIGYDEDTGTLQLARSLGVSLYTQAGAWVFGADGSITFPDDTVQTTAYTGQSSGSSAVVQQDTAPTTSTNGTLWFNTVEGRIFIKYEDQWVDAAPLMMPAPDSNIDINSITFADASVQTSAYSNKLVNGVKEIVFDSNGNLILPAGGDILDSTGTSVLSGGSSVAALSDLYDVLIEGPVEGSVLTWNDSQSLWENRSVTAITNTYPDGPTYSVGVGTDGVVSMITSRGTVEFGALPEPGGPTHFHIMKGTGQDGSGGMDLFFGDDYNYIRQRPAQYGDSPAYGVEVGANDISTNTSIQYVWRFGTDGILTLPAGGDIVDSTGTSLLGGGSGAVGPTGPQGEVGPTGPAGSDGSPGAPGMDGLPGAPGSNGIDGLDGAPGPQGDTGPTGPQGDAGPTGAQGVVGPTGPAGLVGDYVSALTAGTGTSVSASTGSVTVWFNTSTLVTAAVSANTAASLYNSGYTLRSVAVPGNLAGSAGDTVGDIASNGTNLYYCTVSSTQTNYIGITAGGASNAKFVNLLKSGYNGPSAPVAGMIVTLRGVSHTITSVTDQSTYWQLSYSASESASNWSAGETVTITTEPAVGNIWKTVPWDAISTSTTSTVTIGNSTVATSTSTGALQVRGGVGIGGNLYANTVYSHDGNFRGPSGYGQISLASGGEFTIPSNLAMSSGGLIKGPGGNTHIGLLSGTGGSVRFYNTATISGTTTSVSTTTGALTVAGGVGIGGDINVGGTSSNVVRRASGLVAADTYVILDDLQARVTSGSSQLSLILTSGSWQGTGWTETFTIGTPSISNWINLPLSTGYDFASGAMNSQGHGCRCVISDQTPSAKMYQITVIRSGTSGAMWNISIERLV